MRITLALVCTLAVSGVCEARFAGNDVEEVPVGRLIGTAHSYLDEHPEDARSWYVLGRLYTMGYALGVETLEASVVETESGLHLRTPFPYNRSPVGSGDPEHRGDPDWLEGAIAAYERACELAPENAIYQIGLAWSLDEAGRDEDAVRAYREAFRLSIPGDLRGEGTDAVHAHTISHEAYEALSRLLDAKDDAEELAEMREQVEEIPPVRMMTPVIVPLVEGAGLDDLVSEGTASFNLDGHGEAEWSWVTAEAGLLVWDPTEKGEITSGLQLFGQVTFWVMWEHGYQPLAMLDDDRDGILRGEELSGIRVWCDRNHDGVSQAGEVQDLEAHGVVGLSVVPSGTIDDQLMCEQGVLFADGTWRASYDWIAERP